MTQKGDFLASLARRVWAGFEGDLLQTIKVYTRPFSILRTNYRSTGP